MQAPPAPAFIPALFYICSLACVCRNAVQLLSRLPKPSSLHSITLFGQPIYEGAVCPYCGYKYTVMLFVCRSFGALCVLGGPCWAMPRVLLSREALSGASPSCRLLRPERQAPATLCKTWYIL